jgi:hypothetical protein
MSSRFLAHYEPFAAPPPEDHVPAALVQVAGLTNFAQPLPFSYWLARPFLAGAAPPDRLAPTTVISADFFFAMEV